MEDNKLTYEEAIAELEKILDELENEELTLEQSMNNFKRGLELYKHCNEVLKTAEGEVKILLGNDKESLYEYDFIKETDDEYY